MLWKVCPECGGVANWNSHHHAFECEKCDWVEYRHNFLEYKGFYTVIEFDAARKMLYGKVKDIPSSVNFCSMSTEDIEEEFHDAVDRWLSLWGSDVYEYLYSRSCQVCE